MQKKTIKAILVNAYQKTVIEIETESTLEAFYALLSDETHKCDMIENSQPRGLAKYHHFYVDESGALKPNAHWGISSYPGAIAGNGLLICDDGEGEDVDCTMNLEAVKKLITFL